MKARLQTISLPILIMVVLSLLLPTGCGESDRRPNVLLIVIDTMAADHMSCYGYYRETCPAIDSLAATGTMWARAQAQAPWTLPSMASILTGLTVKTHGCRHDEEGMWGLDPELPTIATVLSEEGYCTAAFMNIIYLGPEYGMSKDFGHLLYREDGNGMAGQTVDSLLTWLDREGAEEPFFVFFHLFDPHLPYDPPGTYQYSFAPEGTMGITDWQMDSSGEWSPEQVQHLIDLYDGEISWTDSQLRRLFSALRERGLTENTLLILTSDHGEEFLEHGDWGHGPNLYQHALHVPLIITGPGIPEGVIDSSLVGLIDIFPTVLAYLEAPPRVELEGLNLLADGSPADRMVPSSGVYSDSAQTAGVVAWEKVIWSPVDDSSEMFDLEMDPGEMNPLPVDSLLLEEILDYWAWPCLWVPFRLEFSEEKWELLHDLGYVD